MQDTLKTLLAIVVLSLIGYAVVSASTIVPGHQKNKTDADKNGYPDIGVEVNGHYTSLYAYDDNGNWYWDLGDGRVRGNVSSVEELDKETLTTCDYQVNYRGTFDNDPFLNSGWIQNHINCSGFDDNNKYNYLIVHESDPRYTGNPELSIWGNWEYKALTISGYGNLARPEKSVGQKK